MGRQPLPTNTILGNGSDQYRIDTVIGPGGFGVTYLARDVRFDRDVAIKEYFPADFAYRDGSTTIRSSTRGSEQNYFEQGKRHFLDEARTLAKFRHEHIVRVLNFFEQFNTAYMVLEFEEGQSLKAWLRGLGRAPTQGELDAIVGPMLSALEMVHSKGMFHRDIAPDNIIIRPNGRPVLIDFGAARNFVREHSHTIGAIVKHGYSPPEQYTLETRLQGAWSDIYSLSATIYAAITNAAPEEAAKRQLQDTLLPIAEQLDPRLRDLYRPSFLRALEAGLQIRPKDRPQTIGAFRALVEGASVIEPLADAVPRPDGIVARSTQRGSGRASATGTVAPSGVVAQSDVAVQSRREPARAQPSRSSVTGFDGGTRVTGLQTASAQARAQVAASPAAVPDPVARDDYPEVAARRAGMAALAVAALAAFGFLQIGGIEHPGGLAAAMLVCGGLVAAALERWLSLSRAAHRDVAAAAVPAAIMASLGLAVYWLPLFFWPLSIVLVGAAALVWLIGYGRWVPLTLLGLALVHLALGGVLLLLSLRAQQKDPLFLPMMASSLIVLAGLTLASAITMGRRAEVRA